MSVSAYYFESAIPLFSAISLASLCPVGTTVTTCLCCRQHCNSVQAPQYAFAVRLSFRHILSVLPLKKGHVCSSDECLGGSGLGLCICKTLATAMGGSISFVDNIDADGTPCGTCMTVRLKPSVPATEAAGGNHLRSSRTTLVVPALLTFTPSRCVLVCVPLAYPCSILVRAVPYPGALCKLTASPHTALPKSPFLVACSVLLGFLVFMMTLL